MEDLTTFTHLIHGTDFFEAIAAGVEDREALLDKREHPTFDNAWGRAFEALREMPYQKPMAEADVVLLRELAFKAMFRLTEDPDISAYVSDDIGLIADSLAKGLESIICNQLLASYKAGVIPS